MSGKPFGGAITGVLLVGPVCLGLPPQVDLLVKLQIRTIITTFSHTSSCASSGLRELYLPSDRGGLYDVFAAGTAVFPLCTGSSPCSVTHG